ncbi:MAG: hypothetical protein ACHQHN_04530 [Sphingobacteriales bacterium]
MAVSRPLVSDGPGFPLNLLRRIPLQSLTENTTAGEPFAAPGNSNREGSGSPAYREIVIKIIQLLL